MGLAVLLLLILLIPLIVGILGILCGAIILIVRYVKRRKTQNEYIASKVIGIVFIVYGFMTAMLPIVLLIMAELSV